MTAKNPITGDLIKTKVSNDTNFNKNYGAIDWSVKLETPNPNPSSSSGHSVDSKRVAPLVEHWSEEDEKRLEIIGQNGNTGYDPIK
jgi:hypothetical protein